jgi:DNA-binding NtrC family response regulator
MGNGKRRLLVIHPDATVGANLCQRLSRFADHAEWCQEGVEGIQRCYQQRYNVVLVARWLRDMDAFEVVEKVRFRDQHVPFIILAEAVHEALAREASRVGCCRLCALSAGPQPLEALLEETLRQEGRRLPRKPCGSAGPA